MEKTNQTAKIAIFPESDTVLNSAVDRVNRDFTGGRINKLELASWAIVDSLENLSDSKVEKIRKQFFNVIAYLEAMTKQARANGLDKLPPEAVATLQNLLGQKSERNKKNKDDSEPIQCGE
jgi:hypothetical protein